MHLLSFLEETFKTRQGSPAVIDHATVDAPWDLLEIKVTILRYLNKLPCLNLAGNRLQSLKFTFCNKTV